MSLRSLAKPMRIVSLYKPSTIKIAPPMYHLKHSYSAVPNNKPNTSASEPTNKADPSTNATSSNAFSAAEATTVAAVDQIASKATTSSEIQTTATATENKADEKPPQAPVQEHGYAHGAHHWNMERASALVLIPLISTQLTYGAHPIVDGLMGVVLPYHIYMGFDSCIIDYIPKRTYPRLHKASMWTLRGTTGLVMWACYEFNTNDIGITEFLQRLFNV